MLHSEMISHIFSYFVKYYVDICVTMYWLVKLQE